MCASWRVRLGSLGLAAVLIVAIGMFARRGQTTSPQQVLQPAQMSTALPPRPAPATPVSSEYDARHAIDAYRRQYWDDPSLDPEALKRAYAPPPRSLPKEARPETLPIHPPEQEWRKAQRTEDAIAY